MHGSCMTRRSGGHGAFAWGIWVDAQLIALHVAWPQGCMKYKPSKTTYNLYPGQRF